MNLKKQFLKRPYYIKSKNLSFDDVLLSPYIIYKSKNYFTQAGNGSSKSECFSF